MDEIEKRARELLAAEYEREGMDTAASTILSGGTTTHDEQTALRAIAAALRSVQALSQWKPIESAPKDGTTVLIHYTNCLGNGRTVKAKYIPRFYEESGFVDGDGGVDEYDEANDRYTYREGWWEVIDNWGEFGFVKVHEGEPTHWMMMPIPPREAASD